MKKQLVIVGIIVLLVCVGLSGCNEQNDTVSFQELDNHFSKYLGKTVTIEGYIADVPQGGPPGGVALIYQNENQLKDYPYMILLSIPSNITIYSGFYKITGVVEVAPAYTSCSAQMRVISAKAE